MSILFGLSKVPGETVVEEDILHLALATRRYASDGTFVRSNVTIGMGFQPYYTHQRSQLSSQPFQDVNGNMLAFDGRLDNHAELRELLEIPEQDASDSLIVLASFLRWGEQSFSRFIGDWALALWSHQERSLYLARDHAGTRTLYFENVHRRVLWSTCLETFFAASRSRELDEKYAARYLACQSLGDLTPFKGITAVPPAHYLIFHECNLTCKSHWQWMKKGKIRYKTDAEYDEHFMSLFRQSVERRTGAGAPILAQLSGGMDSTSIVCMSDCIRRAEGGTTQDLLDTVSYFDNSDSDWNESPYFSEVENARQKTGIHLALPLLSEGMAPSPIPYMLPHADDVTYENEVRLEEQIAPKGYRIILSGIGGDEVLGGVPNPLPELADHLVSGHVLRFAKRALDWSLVDQTPLIHMVSSTLRFGFSQYFPLEGLRKNVPPWSSPKLSALLTPLQRRVEERGSLSLEPSNIANGRTWWDVIENLPHLNPGHLSRREYRYPYLDRDLVDFLFRVPRERLLQPGRRRSLMRRALSETVPHAILERRRKGFRNRSVAVVLRNNHDRIAGLLGSSFAVTAGLLNPTELEAAVIHAIHNGDQRWLHAAMRLILFELWHKSFAAGMMRPPNSGA
jgi:asparagine synthase (glutamine-hydrolysing)